MLCGSQTAQRLKVKDFLKPHMATMSYLTQFSTVCITETVSKLVCSPYDF